MKSKLVIFGSLMAFGVFGVTNANASYMSNCNTLISVWEKCRASGKRCTAESTAIEQQCKCHALQQGQWKLVMSAVGKDGVCAPPWPGNPVPDPTPPTPPTHKVGDPWYSKDKKEDPKNKKGGAKPVTTYGGERAPGEKSPNQNRKND